MKTLSLLLLIVCNVLSLSAQEQGPIPKISKQMSDYFTAFPKEKVFVATDKNIYKPGETVWFRAFVTDWNHQPSAGENTELFVKLFDLKGKFEVQELYKLHGGSASCDLLLPKELAKGIYFLCVYTSATMVPEDVCLTMITIDPGYSNQWIVETTFKEQISTSSQKNEISLVMRDFTGQVQKNDVLRYQIKKGDNVIEKGKGKTDDAGRISIPFTLPGKTNGEPFVCEISDNRDEWQSAIFLPSNLDQVQITFYPEGGTLVYGAPSKVGFTAFNKWGIPVDVEGIIQNLEGQTVTQVKTFTKGLGLFSIDNASNQKYKLVLSGLCGQNQAFDLPVSNANGLAFSVVKTDAEFISCNLYFGDKLKHSVVLAVVQGSSINWAADMEIDKTGRIKIPAASLPQGINQLSVFTKEGELLAERIVYIDKKQEYKISPEPEKPSLSPGQSMKVKVRLTDENNQPLAGNISVAVRDKFYVNSDIPDINESLMIGSELETPFSLISNAFKGKITNTTLLDVFMIANRVKGFDWAEILSAKQQNGRTGKPLYKMEEDKNFESKLPIFIANLGLRYSLSGRKDAANPTYYANNEDLFQKAPKVYKVNTVAIDNQRKMFASATSILDVIKTLKPFKVVNNQIVFIGSENSFNYQGGALIVLDGQQLGTDISALSSISPMEVDHINVSTNVMDIQKYTGLNSVGVIEIFQKKAANMAETPVQQGGKTENGYRIPGLFPAPPSILKRDSRTTLMWIANQPVDKSGQFEFSVTAGKVITDFEVIVQGISENGRIGVGKAGFSVGR
jgi:hypothetical protein